MRLVRKKMIMVDHMSRKKNFFIVEIKKNGTLDPGFIA
jgi:hypothetical protein